MKLIIPSSANDDGLLGPPAATTHHGWDGGRARQLSGQSHSCKWLRGNDVRSEIHQKKKVSAWQAAFEDKIRRHVQDHTDGLLFGVLFLQHCDSQISEA